LELMSLILTLKNECTGAPLILCTGRMNGHDDHTVFQIV